MINPRAVILGVLCGVFVHFLSFLFARLTQMSDPVTLGGVVLSVSIVASSITKADCEEKHRLEKLRCEEKHRPKKKV